MAVFETAGKMLSPALRVRLPALLRQATGPVTGHGDKAASQRMALVAFAIRIVSAALAFVSNIVLARVMGEFEYGVFVFLWVLMVLFGNLSCLGMATAIIRFLPQYVTRGAFDEIRGLTSTARRFVLASATAVALVGMITLNLASGAVESYYGAPAFLGLFALPMIALGDVLDGTARANQWPVMALSPTFLIRPTLIILFMLAAILGGAPATAVTAMQAALAASLATVVIQYAAVTSRLRRHFPAGPRAIRLRTWLNAALPIFLIEGVGYLLTNADVVAVGLFLQPSDVAVYFAAAKTMALVHFVYFSVKAAAGPRFSAIIAEKDQAELAVFATQAARWTFWPALAVGATVLAAGPFLLSLFGPAFGAGHPLMAILLLGILAKALVGPGEMLLIMAGRQTLCVGLYAVALAASVGLNLVLIPRFGLQGAAAATAGALAIEAGLLHGAVRRTLGITLFAFARPNSAGRQRP
jgi:O-antigen/teichoic acid export membrane protein